MDTGLDSGAGFGIDLYNALVVAEQCLPTVSGAYSDCAAKLDEAVNNISCVLPGGPVIKAFADLEATINKVVKGTAANLDATAAALKEAIKLYSDLDSGAAAKLDQLRHEKGEPHVGGNQ